MPKAKLEEKTLVRFRAGTLARIDALAGKNRRAVWLRRVVEAELLRVDDAGACKALMPRAE